MGLRGHASGQSAAGLRHHQPARQRAAGGRQRPDRPAARPVPVAARKLRRRRSQSDGFCKWETKDYLPIQPETQNDQRVRQGRVQLHDRHPGVRRALVVPVQARHRRSRRTRSALDAWHGRLRAVPCMSSLNTIYLPVGHPDNPFAANGQGARLYYVPADIGGRAHRRHPRDTQRYLAGVKGTNYGMGLGRRRHCTSTIGSQLRRRPISSTIPTCCRRCRARAASATTASGPMRTSTIRAIYDFIAPRLVYDIVSENTQFDAKASRDIYKLDGGQMALAFGYEWRREEVNNPGEPGTYSGEVIGLGYSAGVGSRNVNAVYAELYAPILKNLEADRGAALRRLLGLRQHVESEGRRQVDGRSRSSSLRGTYATGFRAPGLYENGNSASAGFTSYIDPVRCPVTDAPSDCGAGQVVSITGRQPVHPARKVDELDGRPGVGADSRPSAPRSTTGTSRPRTRSPPATRSRSSTIPRRFPASVVLRDPTDAIPGIPDSGTVLSVTAPYQNLDKTKTDGIDISARVSLDRERVRKLHGGGRIHARLQFQAHVLERHHQPVCGHAWPDVPVELGGHAAPTRRISC